MSSECLTHAHNGIYWRGGPRIHDVGRLQRHRGRTPPRDPGHADRRREVSRGDRGRPVDVAASGLEAPPGPQRSGTRPVPGGGASPAVSAGTGATATVSRLVGQVRAGVERAAGSDGCLPQRASAIRRRSVTPNRHGSAVVQYPSELVIVTSREFDAPIGLIFDVL